MENKFIVGKWYQNSPGICGYAKCKRLSGNGFYFEERITNEGYTKCNDYWGIHSDMKEVFINEIRKYLPKNHPDLQKQTIQIW